MRTRTAGKAARTSGGGAQLLPVATGAVEGEAVERVQDGQDRADVELGVAFVQAEEEAEQLVGRVDAQPDQGHQQAVAVVVAVRVAGPGGALAGLPLPDGPAVGTVADLSGGEVGQQALEVSRGPAGEAPKGIGGAGQRFVGKHRATSALPDSVGRS